ncbi:hypothetical protein NEF87_001596 [Candidatus Lokiarchaeum ossiferum]|uniref:Solute-binding protein family 5 domain-containing protein n=1 Tax=Candidatus Lokiarchaeum ossiferum TaxID=2951803 RepID=A0ABY6HP66_9ARCH|nr:hypothetical protein NEF87_001596 [Candidatus Lokiarchaeum sp. B-35]
MKTNSFILLFMFLTGCLFYPLLASGESNLEDRPMIYGKSLLAVDLDPHLANDRASFEMIDQIMEGLFSYNLTDPECSIMPLLAVDFGQWVKSNLGYYNSQWNYTLELKQNISFHDDSSFGPEDVVFSFDRLTLFCLNQTPTPIARLYMPLKANFPVTPLLINRTEVLNSTHVRFVLNYKFTAFEALLCHTGSVILPEGNYFSLDNIIQPMKDTLIGTGPYQQVSHQDRLIKLEYFTEYWGGNYYVEAPDILEMHWILYDNELHKNQDFFNGNLDFVDYVSTEFMDEYEASEYHNVRERMASTDISFLGFDNTRLDVHTRKALQSAINYSYIIKNLGRNELARMTSAIPKGILYHDPSIFAPAMNLTEARMHLIQAVTMNEQGMDTPENWAHIQHSSSDEDWETITIETYQYGYNSNNKLHEEIGELCQATFAKIGIRLELNGMTWKEFPGSLSDHKFQIFMLEWEPNYNDPSNILNALFLSTSNYNYVSINNSVIDTKLNEGLFESNPSLREEIYHELQNMIVELAPCSFLFTSNKHSVYSFSCENLARNSLNKVYFYLWDFTYEKIPGSFRNTPLMNILATLFFLSPVIIFLTFYARNIIRKKFSQPNNIQQKRLLKEKKKKNKYCSHCGAPLNVPDYCYNCRKES